MAISRRSARGSGASLKVTVKPGPELNAFVRDFYGHFLPGMQAAVASAHRTMMAIYKEEIFYELKRQQAAYPTGNRRGTSKTDSLFYKVLVRDHDIDPIGKMLPPSMGWTIDIDDALNTRIIDPETGRAYWRAVDEGYSRVADGHMFTSHPLGSGGLVRPGLENGVQARMPQVGTAHRFKYSFGGYNFVGPGARKGTAKIRKNAEAIYMGYLPFPQGMRAAYRSFKSGDGPITGPDPRFLQGD